MLTNNFIHAVPSINVPIEWIKYISYLEYVIGRKRTISNRIQIIISDEE